MKNSNDSLILGIDHGYGNIKTENKTFSTGVYVSDTEPAFKDNLLTWNGNTHLLRTRRPLLDTLQRQTA